MEKLKMGSGLGFFFLAVFLFSGNTVEGMSPKVRVSSSALEQSYVWYDGARERKIWVNPGLIAEFISTGSEQAPEHPGYPKTMVVVSQKSGARFWRLDEGITPAGVFRGLKISHPQGKFSPVFHEQPTTGGRKRSLPGNIIVYLNPGWEQGAVEQWAAGRRLQIIKQLEIGPNVYVIKTGPGLESLDLANSLYLSGEVVAAFPNWWEEMEFR